MAKGIARSGKSGSATKRPSSPDKKQTKLSFGQPTKRQDTGPAIVIEQPHPGVKVLHVDDGAEVLKYVETYKAQPAQAATEKRRTERRARQSRGAAVEKKEESELELCAVTMLEKLRPMMQSAFDRGEQLPPEILCLLVLMVRCSVLLGTPAVSLECYSILQRHLARFPHATVSREESSDRPLLLVNSSAVWAPLSSILTVCCNSRSRVLRPWHVLSPDVQQPVEGRHLAQGLKFVFTLMEAAHKAAKDGDAPSQGDLLIVRYLLGVLHQDLHARLDMLRAWVADPSEAVRDKCLGMLRNGLLWRMAEDESLLSGDSGSLVAILMQLAVRGGKDEDEDEEPTALSPGGVSESKAVQFRASDVGGMAMALLNMLLEMYGAAEAAGFFASKVRVRGGANHRMLMDKYMLDSFLRTSPVYFDPAKLSCFLMCLAPRDRARLLGMFIADKYSRTYESEGGSSLVGKRRFEALYAAHIALKDEGRGATGYTDVDMAQTIAALGADLTRSLKVYSTADHLAALAAATALSSVEATSVGAEQPEGGADLKEGALAFIKTLAERSSEGGLHALSAQSAALLAGAHMLLSNEQPVAMTCQI